MDRSIIYCYHENVNGLDRHPGLKLWEESWQKFGWQTKVLSSVDAKKSEIFERFDKAITSFPTVNISGFDYHAFMRWIAVASIGGGISTEPDVINYGLRPEDVINWFDIAKDNILQCHSPVPAVLLGTQKAYMNVCEKICNHIVTLEDNFEGRPHLSDQDFSRRYCNGTLVNFYENSFCAEAFNNGWETAKVVHYGTPYMAVRNLLPKHEHIPNLRPV